MFKGVEPRSVEHLKELRRTYWERRQKEAEEAKALKVQQYFESMPKFDKETLEREILPKLELAFQADIKFVGLTYYHMITCKRLFDSCAFSQSKDCFWYKLVNWMYSSPSKEQHDVAMNHFAELLLAIREMWAAYYPDMMPLFEGEPKEVREFRLEEK